MWGLVKVLGERQTANVMDTHIYTLQIRVLICREDGEFVARALELDVLGYGRSEIEALQDLKHAVEAQISFASQMNDRSLIMFQAEEEYIRRWEEANRKVLGDEIFGDKSMKLQARACMLSFTRGELKALRSTPRFSRTPLFCAETS